MSSGHHVDFLARRSHIAGAVQADSGLERSTAEEPQRPPVAARRRSPVRSAMGAVLGVPVLVLFTMVMLIFLDQQPASIAGQRIRLSSPEHGSAMAIVYGGGTGLHIRRISKEGAPISADLSRGPLRAISMETIRIDASRSGANPATLSGHGHSVTLTADGRSISGSAWL